jgi:hypothetical protein
MNVDIITGKLSAKFQERGVEMILRKQNEGSYDVETGGVEIQTHDYLIHGFILSKNNQTQGITSSNTQEHDYKIIFYSEILPSKLDKIIFENDVYTILDFVDTRPFGFSIMYTVFVKL